MHEVVREYSVTVTSVDDIEPVSSVTLCKEVTNMKEEERESRLTWSYVNFLSFLFSKIIQGREVIRGSSRCFIALHD